MSTVNQSDTQESPNLPLAVYKGHKVAVYMVDKTEAILTREDVVELVNVSTVFCLCLVNDVYFRQLDP